jgi:hypothetical protein
MGKGNRYSGLLRGIGALMGTARVRCPAVCKALIGVP